MARYKVTQELRSESKVAYNIYVKDFFFLIIYAGISLILGNAVHESLIVPFYIFSIAIALFLTLPSTFNKKRRNWQSILILLNKDEAIYHPVKNPSKKRSGER